MNLAWVMGVALIAVVGSQFLKRFSPESAQLLPLTAVVLLLLALLPQLETIVTAVRDLGQQSGLGDNAVGVVLRGVGIGLVTHIASGVCNDCGQRALGETVDYCGQIAIVSLAVPMILDLAQRILDADF